MSLDGKLEIYGITDVGRKRTHNEDTIGSDQELGIVILADGMGGYNAGEVASAMAVTTILEELRESLRHAKRGHNLWLWSSLADVGHLTCHHRPRLQTMHNLRYIFLLC